ncbi:MAG: hypothetical protein P9L92_12105 [Candidatus Electryonea clarkiae]|nr:hypothetical protein [Candidatus Electryonea clarkiae]MDP8287625.1 hypothetical protein [Candidatus Electryonea clarkiae]
MQLITRLDFDGLVCAAMLYEMENITTLNYAEPRQIEERRMAGFDFKVGDAISHLPYHPDARLWFHHHDYEHLNPEDMKEVRGKWEKAPSTSFLIYEFYNSPKLEKFGSIVEVADRISSGFVTKEDVLDPQGWMLINYTLDPRRFPTNQAYGNLILEGIRGGKAVDDLLKDPQVSEKVEHYFKSEEIYAHELSKYTTLEENVIITDYRDLASPPLGNRFTVFLKYPEGNAQIEITRDKNPNNLLVRASRSIFNRSSNINIGHLMERYGGGGLSRAGSCPIPVKGANPRIAMIVDALKND